MFQDAVRHVGHDSFGKKQVVAGIKVMKVYSSEDKHRSSRRTLSPGFGIVSERSSLVLWTYTEACQKVASSHQHPLRTITIRAYSIHFNVHIRRPISLGYLRALNKLQNDNQSIAASSIHFQRTHTEAYLTRLPSSPEQALRTIATL